MGPALLLQFQHAHVPSLHRLRLANNRDALFFGLADPFLAVLHTGHSCVVATSVRAMNKFEPVFSPPIF